MLDKVSDVLSNIKDRLSNTFIFSFLISWPFFNWQVTVALLWYDPKQIEKAGYTSLFDVIQVQSDIWHALLYPGITALLYTAFIRNLLNALQTWASNWGDRLNLRLSKGGSIPIEKFLNLREIYKKETKQLEQIIKDESKTLEDYESERTKRLTAEQKSIELQATKNDLENVIDALFNNKFLNGKWTMTIRNSPNEDDIVYYVTIQNGEIYSSDIPIKKLYSINNYVHNTKTHKITFVKQKSIEDIANSRLKVLQHEGTNYIEAKYAKQFLVNSLTVHDENYLSGTENEVTEIFYRRTDKQ